MLFCVQELQNIFPKEKMEEFPISWGSEKKIPMFFFVLGSFGAEVDREKGKIGGKTVQTQKNHATRGRFLETCLIQLPPKKARHRGTKSTFSIIFTTTSRFIIIFMISIIFVFVCPERNTFWTAGRVFFFLGMVLRIYEMGEPC